MQRPAVSRRRFIGRLGALLGAALWVGGLVPGAWAQAPAAQTPAKRTKTVRLLTVGNSFSGDATRLLDEITAAAGNVLVYRTVSIGGGSMAQHWEKAQQYERDPKDPRGLYGSKRSLREELLAEPWDFVTIQQASILSHNPATYRPFAAQLQGLIKQLAPRAELLVHQTWAYRIDDSRFAARAPKPGEPKTQREMYEGLTRAYDAVAAELGGLRVIPVGDAFFRADGDPTWGYQSDARFDFKTAAQPALPDQRHSLHIGWRWKPQADTGAPPTLTMDGHHASVAGQYLGACVFYEALFGESAEGNSFVPRGMDPAYARFLQKTAHATVQERRDRKKAP